MASNKQLSATILIFSILFYSSTFSLACNTCKPHPKPPTPAAPAPAPAPKPETCPEDTLKFGACMDLLGLVNLPVGTPPQASVVHCLKAWLIWKLPFVSALSSRPMR